MIKWSKWYTFISFIVLFIYFYVFVFNKQQTLCENIFSETVKEFYEGIIIQKYIDNKNHMNKTLIIRCLNENDVVKVFNWDKSGLFEFVQQGDMIIKKSNEKYIYIKRDSLEKVFELDFKCNIGR
jgi:hypothetical protein